MGHPLPGCRSHMVAPCDFDKRVWVVAGVRRETGGKTICRSLFMHSGPSLGGGYFWIAGMNEPRQDGDDDDQAQQSMSVKAVVDGLCVIACLLISGGRRLCVGGKPAALRFAAGVRRPSSIWNSAILSCCRGVHHCWNACVLWS